MDLKNKLKILRKEHGLTQQDIADSINVSRSVVAKWETGLVIPKDELLKDLALIFKVPVSELKTNNNWELTRFATLDKYVYRGIAGKLFSIFIKEYNPNKVISYADRRWTLDKDNNLYTKLGFNLDKINPPDYRYYNERVSRFERIHKMKMMKSKLSKKYGFPMDMTEWEMARELGYDRIWDCGLFRYMWKKKETPSK